MLQVARTQLHLEKAGRKWDHVHENPTIVQTPPGQKNLVSVLETFFPEAREEGQSSWL